MQITKEKYFYKTLFSLTGVIALQNLIVFGVNLADNFMLGNYSESALSGVALVNQIQFFLQMLIMGIGEGSVVLAARSWGEKKTEPIRKLSGLGVRLALLIALIMFILVYFFPSAMLGLFTNDTAILSEGVKYLKIICFSYFFFAVTNVLISTFRSVESTKIGFYISLSTLIINVILNYTLIYGHFGAPEMGVRGAAVATLTARIIETAIILIYSLYIDKKINIKIQDFFKKDASLRKTYFTVCLPVLMSNAMWGLAQSVQTAILGHMGPSAVAANSIATTIFQIVSVAAYGCASASGVLIGKTIGELKTDKIKPYTDTLQIIYVIIGAVSSLILFSLRNFILGFYDISPESEALARSFITVLAVTVFGTSYQMSCLTGIVRAGGDTKFVLKNDLIFMWLIVIPSAAICAFALNLSPVIVFICLKSDQVLKCAVAVVKVNSYNWIKKINNSETK